MEAATGGGISACQDDHTGLLTKESENMGKTNKERNWKGAGRYMLADVVADHLSY